MRRVLIFLLLGLPLSTAPGQTISNAERVVNWKEDLRFFAATLHGTPIPGEKNLPGQKDFAKLYPRFDADIAALETDLPNLRNGAIDWRLAKILASAHVGHNSIFPGDPQQLPLFIEWLDEGPAVTAASAEYKNIIGTHLMKVGELSSAQFLDIVSPYLAYETEGWRRVLAAMVIRRRALMEMLSLVQDGKVKLTFEGPNGPMVLDVAFAPEQTPLVPMYEALGLPIFMVRSQQGYYWRKFLTDSQTLYIQYNVCADDPKLKFADFAAQTLAQIDESKPSRVIVDLRFNQGGNSAILNPLTSGLASRSKIVGRPFVLIGPQTFSSGVMAAQELRKKAKAVIVGTTTGGQLGGYGESPSRKLPHSQIGFQWTIKNFPHAEPVSPDITVMPTIAEFRVGRDPVLEAAIAAR